MEGVQVLLRLSLKKQHNLFYHFVSVRASPAEARLSQIQKKVNNLMVTWESLGSEKLSNNLNSKWQKRTQTHRYTWGQSF